LSLQTSCGGCQQAALHLNLLPCRRSLNRAAQPAHVKTGPQQGARAILLAMQSLSSCDCENNIEGGYCKICFSAPSRTEDGLECPLRRGITSSVADNVPSRRSTSEIAFTWPGLGPHTCRRTERYMCILQQIDITAFTAARKV
jgi:hypothetical protein